MKNPIITITVSVNAKEQLTELARINDDKLSAYIRKLLMKHLRDGTIK